MTTAISKPRFSVSVPFQRMQAAHPDLPPDEILALYRRYLRSLSLVDPTPANDIVGWIVRRMTGKQVLDATIVVYGDKGAGKSYVCGYLAERIAKRLSEYVYRANPPEAFFTINNLRTVDKSGTLEMLTPQKMREKTNQIYILDDASVATNARNFQSQYNKNLNEILTTARIYRHCIILNTVSSGMIDSVARSLADMGILVEGLIPNTTINRCKIYRTSQLNQMGFGKGAKNNIGKFLQLTLNGEQHRMKTWYTNKPSDAWCEAYDKLRKENTDKLGTNTEDEDGGGGYSATKKGKHKSRDQTRKEMIRIHYSPVIDTYRSNDGKINISKVALDNGISREWVRILISEGKRRQEI